MLDAYKRRLKQSGSDMSEAIKQQDNMIMNATFKNSSNYKSVIIDNENIDARYLSYKTTSINGDAVDYLIQFRPHVKYPLGTYISIPNEEKVYEDWIIVSESYDILFPKYNILKCNYTLKWIVNKEIIAYKVALRSRGSSLGIANNDYMTVTDGQMSAWLPTNQEVKAIDYASRFLISNNEIHPKSYKVTDVGDVLSQGITKLTLSKDEVGIYDNIELMIADYYKQFPKTNVENGLFTYQLLGVDSISVNSNAVYKVQTLLDKEIYPTTNVVYSVTTVTGEVTDLVTYTIENDEVKISTNGTKGTFMISASIDGVVIDRTIKIKGLL